MKQELPYRMLCFAVSLCLFAIVLGAEIPLNIDKRYSKIPSYLKICHRSDPKLNDCIKDSVEQLRPQLYKGIPELGIPSCDPLIIPELIMNQGKGSVTIQSSYSNINIYGPSDFTLRSVKLDLDKNRLRISLMLPQLFMSSNYSISGRILMLPIIGSGHSYGNYSNIDATAVIQGERVMRNGKIYFNIVDFFVDFIIGHANVHLSDLFNGDKELGDAMNLFLNDNWRNIAQEVKPVLEETIGDLFRKFANKIFHKYPMEELLPP